MPKRHKKNKRKAESLSLIKSAQRLSERNRFGRTFADASAALDAVAADHRLAVNHRNRAHRASTDASFATAAFVAINFCSHLFFS